jgi:hypothetical protein
MENEVFFYSTLKNFRYIKLLKGKKNYSVPKKFRYENVKWKELIPENLSFIKKHFRLKHRDWRMAGVILAFSLAHMSSEMFLLINKIMSDKLFVVWTPDEEYVRIKFLRMIENGKIEKNVIQHLHIPHINYFEVRDKIFNLDESDFEIAVGVILDSWQDDSNLLILDAIKGEKKLDVFKKFYREEFIDRCKLKVLRRSKKIKFDPNSHVDDFIDICHKGWLC